MLFIGLKNCNTPDVFTGNKFFIHEKIAHGIKHLHDIHWLFKLLRIRIVRLTSAFEIARNEDSTSKLSIFCSFSIEF